MYPGTRFSALLIGEGNLIQECAECLLRNEHSITGIVSPDGAVREWAAQKGIPTTSPASDIPAFVRSQSEAPDYLFSIVNFSIIPPEVLALPTRWAINFHDGPLPEYAGLFTTSWSLLNREKMHAVTWHTMTDKVDAGEILKVRQIPLDDRETALSLNIKCYEAGVSSFSELVTELSQATVKPVAQDLSRRNVYGRFKRPPVASVIQWNKSAEEIDALVRGLDFGAYANDLGLPKLVVGDAIYIVREASLGDAKSETSPGTIEAIEADSLTVATATYDISIRRLESIDGRPVSISDFVAATKVTCGDRLPVLPEETSAAVTEFNHSAAKHEAFWVKRLTNIQPFTLPLTKTAAPAPSDSGYESVDLRFENAEAIASSDEKALTVLSAFCAYLTRISDGKPFDIGFSFDNPVPFEEVSRLFASQVPFRVEIDERSSFSDATRSISAQATECKASRRLCNRRVSSTSFTQVDQIRARSLSLFSG